MSSRHFSFFWLLPRAHPGARSFPWGGGDSGGVKWRGRALNRCHPRIAAPGAQRSPALLKTRAREERGQQPCFPRRGSRSTHSEASWHSGTSPLSGAEAVGSRTALLGLPVRACQVGQLSLLYTNHAGPRPWPPPSVALSSLLRHIEREFKPGQQQKVPFFFGCRVGEGLEATPLSRSPAEPSWRAGGDRRRSGSAS